MSCRGTISLVGDSILDNFYWLTNKEQDLRKELADLGFTVYNYAVDESTVKDIIHGITPKDIYKNSRSYPYPVDSEGKLCPLRLLEQRGTSFTPVYGGIKPLNFDISVPENMIVLSIGGNNFQVGVTKVILGIDYFFNSVVTKEFIADYENLVEKLRKVSSKVILISMYLPFLGPGSSYGVFSKFAEPVMNRWRPFLESVAKKYNIPILDLSRTFNSYRRDHYGTSDIEPSNVSNSCMAKCLAYIYDNYDGHHTYFAPDCDIAKITTL
ncbi:Hypothetical protein HVR_LOCUS765 [uncultured virus]|nr:Hypothetical protein HVR_LOCUS765 [uncultured virus]